MVPLALPALRRPLRVLCFGAHCDDIEIGCAATLMRLADERPLSVTWIVLTSTPQRAAEARRSASLVLRDTRSYELGIAAFRDGFMPAQWSDIKSYFEALKSRPKPDLIFTHERGDLHQDHRLVNELTWNTFRDHLILEYEIPKFDGGLGQPSIFVPVSRKVMNRKCRQLDRAFASQRKKPWFSDDTFRALMRIRGLECNAPDGYAEAFFARKLCL